MSEGAGRAYLAEALYLDPAQDHARVMELRRARRVARGGGDRVESYDEGAVREELSAVARDLLDEDPAALRARLDALDVSRAPALSQRARRLRAVIDARPAIDAGTADPRADAAFADFVRRLLRANAQQAAELKRRSTTTLRNGARFREARRTIRLWRDEYPELHELERVWFDEDALGTTRAGRGVPIWIFVAAALWIVIKFSRFLLRD